MVLRVWARQHLAFLARDWPWTSNTHCPAGNDAIVHPSSICLPLPPTHRSWASITYLAQMRLLLESLQELGVMLLVHQLLLDGLGVLGQGFRAGPAQRFMVAWERQALCRDERGGEGEGDRSQTWHWRGEEREVRGDIVHWADVTPCRAVSPHRGKQQCCLYLYRLSPDSRKNASDPALEPSIW